MILDQESSKHLKPWLVKTLEPICDAEPGALADYVLALLKHNGLESELRKEMESQLDEFLEKECSPFLDTLFTALRTKSYLPYSASPSTPSMHDSVDGGIPIPVDGLLSSSGADTSERGQKRPYENEDARDDLASSKGPRLSADGQFSRYNGRSTGGWSTGRDSGGFREGDGMNGMSIPVMGGAMGNGRRYGPQGYQPPDAKRGICRDYHNTGYCARGAYCKYSHGDDAMVPEQMFAVNGQGIQNSAIPFMAMFGNGYGMGGGPVAYDPREARMDMRQMGNSRSQMRPPIMPRLQQDDGNHAIHGVRGELPVIQDLTPNVPQGDLQPNPNVHSRPPQEQQPVGEGQLAAGANGAFPAVPQNTSGDVEMAGPAEHPASIRPPRNLRGGLRGRGPGTFNNDAPNFRPERPERRKDKTLVVEKIPEDKLTLELVNNWFKRFGTVTNVAIDRSSAKALISFSTHEEAHAAWKSEDAVFNNRFVKVFWHRPMEGHGQVGARMLAASAPALANLSAKEASSAPSTVSSSNAPPHSSQAGTAIAKKPAASSQASALAAKQQLLEQQIAEQKSLMASLETASADEKKDIMARLRKLGEEMTASPTTLSASPKKPANQEQKEKERLDKELEPRTEADGENEGETTEDLKAKLERLKEEAASLGINTSPHNYGSTSYRPYRGRGRGSRGYYRGATRGGPPRGSMKLDNRPKKLLVKGVGSEHLQTLQDWYETTGQVDSLSSSDNGDIIVTFKTRSAAEQGLAKGNDVPVIGHVQVLWYTGSADTASSTAKPSSKPHSEDIDMHNSVAQTPESERPGTPQEEEVVASGWGGDAEDGMGML